jgi:hypothetical protein
MFLRYLLPIPNHVSLDLGRHDRRSLLLLLLVQLRGRSRAGAQELLPPPGRAAAASAEAQRCCGGALLPGSGPGLKEAGVAIARRRGEGGARSGQIDAERR